MRELLWAECLKLRRSKILWIAVFATIMVAIVVFAQGQFVHYGVHFIDKAGWYLTAAQSLATFYVLPAMIALFGSYMICREEQEDMMKSLRLIPVNEPYMTAAKMLITLLFSIAVYASLFLIAFIVELVLHREALSIADFLSYFKIYLLDGIGVFMAIAPIIALVALIKKGYWLALIFTEIYSFAGIFVTTSPILKMLYPISAVFNVSGYYQATLPQILGSLLMLVICAGCAPLLLMVAQKADNLK